MTAPGTPRRAGETFVKAGTGLITFLLLALAALAVPVASVAQGSLAPVRVRYLSADTVFLDAGSDAGIDVGDRWLLSRDGATVAEIEVVFVARLSASCRVVRTLGEIRVGDLATAFDSPPLPIGAGTAGTGAGSEGGIKEGADTPVPPGAADGTSPEPTPSSPPPPRLETAYRTPTYGAERRPTRISGTLAVDWESATSGDLDAYDFTRTSARLNLRIRDIGGHPYEFRARVRRREIDRDRLLDGLPSTRETRDRFYELSFNYDPPEGRYSYSVGRLGARSSVLGYLDGALGRVSLSRAVAVGGFVGARPDLGELSWGAAELKYGLFTEYAPTRRDGRRPFSLFFAGVREEGELDVSREYVALQTRYDTGDRWSFYQRAELDLNNGWRADLGGSAVQLSNLSLGATVRLSDFGRFTLSYDRYERYRTEETRFLSSELFDDLLRQGLRARLSLGRPRHLTASLFAGYRERDDDNDATYSYGLGLGDSQVTRWRLGWNVNLLGYSNQYTEGILATFGARKSFPGGHELSLTVGERLATDRLFETDRSTTWLRVGGWIELPANLFATLGYEVSSGDDPEERIGSASLGYRF